MDVFYYDRKKHVFSKMSVNSIQYRGTVGIFNSQHFVFDLKYKIQSLLIHSRRHVFHITLASYSTRNHVNIQLFKTNHNFFKNFFPSNIMEWNNLDRNLRNSDTYETFKNAILKFIRPSPNSVFERHNLQGIKFLARLRSWSQSSS